MKNENETKVEKKGSQKKKPKKKPKQVSIFLILALIILALLVTGICVIANCILKVIKYKPYTDKMYYYGYNELYSNNRATAYQKVSNIDMLKVIIGTVNNNNNIEQIALKKVSDEVTENDLWYELARDNGIITNVTRDTLDKKATSIDAVITMLKTLEWYLNINMEQANLNMSEKSLSKFNNSEKEYIAKAVALGIINNNDSGISKNTLIKGELNKLIIELANKYATLHHDSFKLDENGNVVKNDVHIITDKESLPESAEEYPYIVSDIKNEIYDADMIVENQKTFQSPKEVYSEMKQQYARIDEIIESYYYEVLNVDYNTIEEELFAYYIGNNSLYKISADDVSEYVKYVKENKIILKGKAETLLPIIYYTGERYVVRTKISFEIVNSETPYNLLYGDKDKSVKYDDKQITMYVDIPMGITLNSMTLRVDTKCTALFMVAPNEKVQVKGEGK